MEPAQAPPPAPPQAGPPPPLPPPPLPPPGAQMSPDLRKGSTGTGTSASGGTGTGTGSGSGGYSPGPAFGIPGTPTPYTPPPKLFLITPLGLLHIGNALLSFIVMFLAGFSHCTLSWWGSDGWAYYAYYSYTLMVCAVFSFLFTIMAGISMTVLIIARPTCSPKIPALVMAIVHVVFVIWCFAGWVMTSVCANTTYGRWFWFGYLNDGHDPNGNLISDYNHTPIAASVFGVFLNLVMVAQVLLYVLTSRKETF